MTRPLIAREQFTYLAEKYIQKNVISKELNEFGKDTKQI